MKPIIYATLAVLFAFSCGEKAQPGPAAFPDRIDEIFHRASQQYAYMASSLPDDQFPKTRENGALKTSGSGWWTSGFYPGTLWYLFEQTGDSVLYKEAIRKLEVLEKEQFNTTTHDLGFMMFCSYGNALRISGDSSYKAVIHQAAKSLSSRFNPKIGCIRSWDPAPWNEKWTFPVIIDNMMNLEMLLWAAREYNDTSFAHIAKTHANTTLKNHFREDFSSCHVVSYDTITGMVEAKNTDQGHADESAWARGQAWGLYGYTVMFRYTRDRRYLDQAIGIANFILKHPALPDDRIPYWDFDAPDIPNAKRDASAAAIIASALLELCSYANKVDAIRYFDVAEQILQSLAAAPYLADLSENGGFLLKHSVGNMPDNTEVDVPLSYADYYYIEALSRYKKAAYTLKSRISVLDDGWAQNSVNTVKFRKNSLTSVDGYQYASFYDPQGFVVLAKRKIGDNTWEIGKSQFQGNVRDAHNAISIALDGDGYLHMAWDHHDSPLRYSRSSKPGSLEMESALPMIGTHEEVVSYPEFYRLPDGNLLFFYRDGGSGNGNLVINRYHAPTKTWSRLQDNLIDGEGQRNAYWQACVDRQGTIHISWVWRESPDVASNHDMCYAKSADGGKSWQNSRGKHSLPITRGASAEIVQHVPMNSELINQTSMTCNAEGEPFIVSYWKEQGENVPQFHLIYQQKNGWKVESLAFRSESFSLSGMGTKQIPIARPEILVSGSNKVYVIFRDAERNNKISLATNSLPFDQQWHLSDFTDGGYASWEPTLDPHLWTSDNTISVLLQKNLQVDGEGLSERKAAWVEVLDVEVE
ncbi:MAG: BNR repeat-containing protein [Bacteroidia bacterium]